MTVAPRKAVFRCDASPVIGTGHVMRCLTLADELAGRDWDCVFWTDRRSPITVPALERSGYMIVQEWDDDSALLLVDHYGLDAAFERSCRVWAEKILAIDDLADREHDCDILVDQTFGREEGDYHALVPSGCEVFTGADYALLRPQFAAARAESLRRRVEGKLENIIVSMGATNIHNITARVLEGLFRFHDAPLKINVITGKGDPYLDDLRRDVNHLNNGAQHEVVLHTDVTDMAMLMAQADLAIGAAGTTSWERCCLGLPSIVIELADNQKTIAANLHAAGAVLNLGWYESATPAAIGGALTAFFAAPEKLVAAGASAAKICDGKGARRLAEAIEDVCS